jgi:hypothetical protein
MANKRINELSTEDAVVTDLVPYADPTTGQAYNTTVPQLVQIGMYDEIKANKTITASGTTGNQTINKPAGSVNFAIGVTSLIVTNSLVTTNSIVIAVVASNDSTMKGVSVVQAAGSFTLHPNSAPTAETRVNFLVIN